MSDEVFVRCLEMHCPNCKEGSLVYEGWDYDQFEDIEVRWWCWQCGLRFRTYHESVEEE